MHTIEPYYNWRNLYIASDDALSPFYERIYSEFEYTNHIYNYVIHPQWDDMGSETLYIKILFCDYEESFCIIELIGEWNDAINNDIMFLKRDIIDELQTHGINKYILIGENVLNFHSSDDCYYEEWFEDVEDGWIAFVNFRAHVIKDLREANVDTYCLMDGSLNDLSWRPLSPHKFFEKVNEVVTKRLN